jgi:hypothetical protein
MSDTPKQLLFSLITGDIYQIEVDEMKNMDKYQIPLTKRPSTSCKKCYGRFHIGYNTVVKVYRLCPKCIPSCVDFNLLASETFEIETAKHV